MRALLCAALALVAGCEPYGEARPEGAGLPPGTPWALACAFPEADRASIRAGLALWPSSVLGPEGACVEAGRGTDGVLVDVAQRVDAATYGAAQGRTVWLYAGWQSEGDEGRRRATVGHELGHLLGLGHVADASCLMASPAWAASPCPAELDYVAP